MILGSLCLLHSVTLHEDSGVNQDFMLKVLPSQMEMEQSTVFYIFISSQTITSLMGQIHLFCMARECFSCTLVWLVALCWTQEVA